MNDDTLPASLRPTAADAAAGVLRFFTSVIDVAQPGAGSLFGELVGRIIPGQREERLYLYVAKWGRRTNELLQRQGLLVDRFDNVDRRLSGLAASTDAILSRLDAEKIALFEEGARSAVRMISSDRIDRLSRLVAEGMFDPAAETGQARAIVDIADQLTDEDVIVLCSHTHPFQQDPDWRERHRDTTNPSRSRMSENAAGMGVWTGAAYDASDLEKARDVKLLRLGLLEQRAEIVPDTSIAQITRDKDYVLQQGGPKITRLGRRVLRDLDSSSLSERQGLTMSRRRFFLDRS